ncbi:MAG: hypothetical protein R6V01_03735 [Thermoplasmatota archaeon]
MARILGILFSFILVVTMPFFIFVIILFLMGVFGAVFLEGIQETIMETSLGWLIILFPGIITLISVVMLGVAWMLSMKWKDLRYKMAFFLYHSKVNNGDRIPLEYLAKVAVSSEPEIKRTLEMMIERKELKGEIDEEERVYIHRGLTKRGMKFLKALPPAKLNQLKDVRIWALKGAEWEVKEDAGIGELEGEETDDLPAVKSREGEEIACPNCGRMNVRNHHFCTFCGEEF